jgi:hypothetical protein
MVSEVLIHGHLDLLVLDLWQGKHIITEGHDRKAAHLMAVGKQREKQ